MIMSHKHLPFKILTLGALLMLSSCGFYRNVVDELSGEDTSTWESDTGYSATDSLNRYIDLLNAGHDNVSYFEDNVIYLESDIANGYDPYFSCYFDVDSYDTTLKYDVENPSGLTETETASLVGQATAIYSTLDQLDVLCDDMARHVTAQDYKDDNYATLNANIEDAYTLIDTYYDQHNTLLDEVDTYFETYDTWEVDLNDPISVGIDNMDKDMDAAEAILDVVEENYINETFDGVSAQIQTMYDELMASVDEHRDYDTGEYANYYYDTFYTELDQNFLPTVKRAMRNFEAQDLSALDWDYSDILDSYNYLVDDYNYYLDATGY